MRLDKNPRLAMTALGLAVMCGLAAAQAQVAPAPSLDITTKATAPVSVDASVAPASASAAEVSLHQRAQQIRIGAPTLPGAAHTVRDLEALQQQAYLLELRAKIQELSKAAGMDMAPGVPGAAMTPAIVPPMSGVTMPVNVQPSGVFAPEEASQPDPEAKLVSVIIAGGKARADVSEGGIVTTVKEGDKLDGGWRVAEISPSGVTVETVVTEMQPVARSAKGKGHGSKGPAMIQTERVVSRTLKPAALAQTTQPGVVSPPAAADLPSIPPLPRAIGGGPDSTSVRGVPPVGGAPNRATALGR